jgi:hypothetical protein
METIAEIMIPHVVEFCRFFVHAESIFVKREKKILKIKQEKGIQ